MTQGVAQTMAGAPGGTASNPALNDLSAAVDRDRRSGIERIIELSRWVILVVAAVTNNFPGRIGSNTANVNVLLLAWGVFNLSTTLVLAAHRLPGRNSQVGMLLLDIAVASGLVYLTGGIASNLGIAFYVVIIAGSLRFGLAGSLTCATLISTVYVLIDIYVSGGVSRDLGELLASRLFLFFVVALTSGLLARELVAARARQMEHTFRLEHAALHELREVDRIKSEFMMLASHELRTPLTKIKAWLTLMQDAGDRLPEAARDEGLHELRSEAEHLARLTDNLLCIAQLESGEIHLKTNAVTVDSVLRDVLGRFVETADRERFLCTIAQDAQTVLADSERLGLVLACLLDNALKFSPESEQVRITAHRVGAKVQIEVHDQGRRIPDSQIDRVFASFYQVESPLIRQRGGFGVGLYLARQLTERMGGGIWIDNTRARGNTFIIGLPVHA